MNDLLQRLVALEQDVDYQNAAAHGEEEYRHVPGHLPVLISAPHGARHTRPGNDKDEDEYTAGMARLLGELTGAHVLYARRCSKTDPNWSIEAPYKQALKSIASAHGIRFVLDLHGMADKWGLGLALGTCNRQSCPRQLPVVLSTLAAHGFTDDETGWYSVMVDHSKFSARGWQGSEPVTLFVHRRLGIPALQIEIRASLRIVQRQPDASAKDPVYFGDPAGILRAIHALQAVVLALLEVI